jgi:hypothetical protein
MTLTKLFTGEEMDEVLGQSISIFGSSLDKCGICEFDGDNDATKIVKYRHPYKKTIYHQYICDECFEGPDFQEWMSMNIIISVKNIENGQDES